MEIDKAYTVDEAKAILAKQNITLKQLVEFAVTLRNMDDDDRHALLLFDEEMARKEGVTLRTLSRLLISHRIMKGEVVV